MTEETFKRIEEIFKRKKETFKRTEEIFKFTYLSRSNCPSTLPAIKNTQEISTEKLMRKITEPNTEAKKMTLIS